MPEWTTERVLVHSRSHVTSIGIASRTPWQLVLQDDLTTPFTRFHDLDLRPIDVLRQRGNGQCGIVARILHSQSEAVRRVNVVRSVHALSSASSLANVAPNVEDMDTSQISVMLTNPVLIGKQDARTRTSIEGCSVGLYAKESLDVVGDVGLASWHDCDSGRDDT